MTPSPLHASTSSPPSPHLPVPPDVGLFVLAVGSVVFGLILYDIARRYEYPSQRGR